MDQRELEVQTEDRCDNYAMLSRLFRSEVDKELLADLIESPVAEPTGNELFDSGYARVRAYLDAIDDLDRFKSALAIDYCLAFLGYGVNPDKADEAGSNAAYPYESIYRTGSKSLGGDHCAEVSDAFRACMFAPTRDRLIADDHIACELEFMQYLANSELTALRAGELAAAAGTRKKELEFLEGHLLAWIGSFGEAVAKFAETDFYTGLLAMTQGWLELDAGQSIVITITRSVGVKIMDHENYELYKADEDCRAFSGQLTSSPYRFKVPREARWHVIINPHTYSGTAEFNVKLIDDAVLGA